MTSIIASTCPAHPSCGSTRDEGCHARVARTSQLRTTRQGPLLRHWTAIVILIAGMQLIGMHRLDAAASAGDPAGPGPSSVHPAMADRTITTCAFTKAYAMDGWRLGYAVASPALIEAMLKIGTNMVTHVNTFIQYGALAAITEGQAEVARMIAEDAAKRDLVVRALNQMPGVTCAAPAGTIYAFPDITGTGRNSAELADAILEECDVVVEAGSFYGAAGEGHLRVCFGSQSDARLAEAMERLSRFFNRD